METQLYILFVSFMDGDSGVYRCSGAGKLLGSYLVEGPLWWNDRVDMKQNIFPKLDVFEGRGINRLLKQRQLLTLIGIARAIITDEKKVAWTKKGVSCYPIGNHSHPFSVRRSTFNLKTRR